MQFLLRLFLVLFLVNWSLTIDAQILAVTERGDTIYVFKDGTWSYTEEDYTMNMQNTLNYLDAELEIDTIQTKFVVGEESDKELQSKIEAYKIRYNSEEWNQVPAGKINPEAEFALVTKDQQIYCMVLIEEITIGTENILKIAMNNAKERAGAEVELLKTESRNVNGVDMLYARYNVDINGMKLIFNSYFHSDEDGTVQFTTWTGPKIYAKSKARIDDLLNGLIVGIMKVKE